MRRHNYPIRNQDFLYDHEFTMKYTKKHETRARVNQYIAGK